MRTIIAGSRHCSGIHRLHAALKECGWVPTVVLSGRAAGADRLGEIWAKSHGVPLELYPANWQEYGKSAGYRRNVQMARKAEALIALWDGSSPGTKHMIQTATENGLKVYVHRIAKWAPPQPVKTYKGL
ncbi:MAG: DUF2493 domain-containing protein [Chromatiales bacterium]|nr:DUF2493 domain-containing protein [Chromatiales bacterium]